MATTGHSWSVGTLLLLPSLRLFFLSFSFNAAMNLFVFCNARCSIVRFCFVKVFRWGLRCGAGALEKQIGGDFPRGTLENQNGVNKFDEAVNTPPKQWNINDWPDLTKMDIFKNSL